MKTFLTSGAVAMIGLASFAQADPVVSCQRVAAEVKASVDLDPAKVLVIVSDKVAAAPSCSCEVVKTAIKATKASPELVAAIVEAAANSAPDQLRLIAQCAVAAAPDALAHVQAVVKRLDPGSRQGISAKSAKGGGGDDGAESDPANPLDLPGGPWGGIGFPGADGNPFDPQFPIFPPVIINPPSVTEVD